MHNIKIKFGWSDPGSSCEEADSCEGDFDEDGDIDATDINAFLRRFASRFEGSCGFAECKGDFDCDTDVDGKDTKGFLSYYGRNQFNNPCTNNNLCLGDFDGDLDCDGTDAASFKKDFGRSPLLRNACRGCVLW